MCTYRYRTTLHTERISVKQVVQLQSRQQRVKHQMFARGNPMSRVLQSIAIVYFRTRKDKDTELTRRTHKRSDRTRDRAATLRASNNSKYRQIV